MTTQDERKMYRKKNTQGMFSFLVCFLFHSRVVLFVLFVFFFVSGRAYSDMKIRKVQRFTFGQSRTAATAVYGVL